MYLALDVHYGNSETRGACVGFEPHDSGTAEFVVLTTFAEKAQPYEPGNFKQRELPYLLALIESAKLRHDGFEGIFVDAYVTLGDGRPGLGHHLHAALGGRVPVIGVAKTRFEGAPAVEVRRGKSGSPLFVTALGIDPNQAAELVASMHGAHRIPTLLGLADRASRGLPVEDA